MNTNNLTTHQTLSDTVVSRFSTYDFLPISCTPANEECTQVNIHPVKDNILECNVYINQLIRQFGEPPAGAYFFVLKNTGHDAGIYYEAAIRYRTDDKEATDYALKVQNGCDNWDDIAKQQLIEAGYSLLTKPAPVIKLRRA